MYAQNDKIWWLEHKNMNYERAENNMRWKENDGTMKPLGSHSSKPLETCKNVSKLNKKTNRWVSSKGTQNTLQKLMKQPQWSVKDRVSMS